MTSQILTAEVRTQDEKLADLRQNNVVPGVIYGKTQEPISIKMDNSDLLRAYRTAGESTIINLKVGKKEIEVLIHDIQRNPRTDAFTHIDFYAVTRGEKVHTNIHLEFIGEATIKKEGAIIEEHMKELEVKCLPRNLVDHFDVDLSSLVAYGDTIKVSDLGIDAEKYEVLNSEDDVVVIASKPRTQVEEEETTEEASTEAEEAGTEEEKTEE